MVTQAVTDPETRLPGLCQACPPHCTRCVTGSVCRRHVLGQTSPPILPTSLFCQRESTPTSLQGTRACRANSLPSHLSQSPPPGRLVTWLVSRVVSFECGSLCSQAARVSVTALPRAGTRTDCACLSACPDADRVLRCVRPQTSLSDGQARRIRLGVAYYNVVMR